MIEWQWRVAQLLVWMQFYSLTVVRKRNATEQRNIIAASLRKGKMWIICSATKQTRPFTAIGPGESNAHRNGSIWEHDTTENIQTHSETKHGFDWKYNQCENDIRFPTASLQQCHCAHFKFEYGNTALKKYQASRSSHGKMGALTVLAHALVSAWSWHLNHSEYAPQQPHALHLG